MAVAVVITGRLSYTNGSFSIIGTTTTPHILEPRPITIAITYNTLISIMPPFLRSSSLVIIPYFCGCFFYLFHSSCAYITFNNQTYPSLQALFGRFLIDGKTYTARIQYFPDNPYLCEIDEVTKRKFVVPTGPQISDSHGANVTLTEPIIVLASRGNCAFQQKAIMAETIHDSVKFLFVYNLNLDHSRDQEDTLVPMYSQYGNTRLVLLSISHGTGQALKLFLSQQTSDVMKLGGPLIAFDSEPPMDILTPADLQSMMLSALGLFFMLISFTGCLVILAGTYTQIAHQQERENGGGFASTPRRLLTLEEVDHLTNAADQIANIDAFHEPKASREINHEDDGTLIADYENKNESNDKDEDEDNQCAVCLDGFDSEQNDTTTLPCGHVFHTDCIRPWLTERQSKCPLCKFDVLEHLRDRFIQEDETGSGRNTASASLWDRMRRYRWLRVNSSEDHHLVNDLFHQLPQTVMSLSLTNNIMPLDEAIVEEESTTHEGVEMTQQPAVGSDNIPETNSVYNHRHNLIGRLGPIT